MSENVRDIVKKIIAEELQIDISHIEDDTSLEDLEIDSLDMSCIILEIESKYDANFPTEDLYNLRTVNDIVAFIESHTLVEK